ncbi:SRPBCC family protein [Archangium sp.]|uniref:SRPBCC family protein n=1 Tax=Archangium sp. TaxID=1872627 RepID=UPI002D31F741|nr:SRPBCC family protein [Archangium sp.]HYO53697.1 SRPBCC family protein [Archangium sp.]
MKRVLKVAGLGLVGLVAVLFGVGLFLPRQWHVERSVLINAAPEHIHPLVNDLKAWQSWAVWTKDMDPEVKHEYSAAVSGVGAWWSWKGPKMGHGKMTIAKSDVSAGVWIDEMIETDQEVNAHGSITWTQEGGGTKVTWVDDGTLPPMGGYFVGMINDMLGENFEQGLKNLKAEAEKRRAAEQEAAQAARQAVQPVP